MTMSLIPRSFWACFCISCFLLGTGLSPAATYVVDQAKGNDSNSGEASSPFQTIQAAISKLQAGDTVLIRNGVYREELLIEAMGTAENPLTIKADEGAKPVVSGADHISSWKACASAEEAAGNPDFAKIYYADIDWMPTAFFENGQKQEISQTPNGGWWPAPETTSLSITDPEKLKGKDLIPEGATLFFFKYKGFAFVRQPIASFDKESGTIHVEKPLGKDQFIAGSDRYRLENHVRYIDQPGEWAWTGKEGSFRIYYMPRAETIDAALIEIPRRGRVVVLSETAHCTIEGLEITKAAYPGRLPVAAVGNDVNDSKEGAGNNITIRLCKIHHNGRYGIFGRGYTNLKIENNLIYRNQYGVALAGQKNTLVQNNEIAANFVDGLIVSHGSKDITVRNNYIHHHSQFGHPDNVQFYRGVDNILLEGNFLLASGQGVMMEQVESTTFKNNIVAGTDANMIIMGHGDANNGTWERNTFALWTSALFALSGQNYTLRNNIMVNTGGTLFYRVPSRGEFSSTENLFYKMEGAKYARMIGIPKADGKEGNDWFTTLEAIQGRQLEAGSVYQPPDFKNVPEFLYTLNPHKVGDCTRETLHYDQKNAPDILAGDMVEVHFDGVARKVTASDQGAITIDPPLPDIPDRVMFVANWKQNSNFVLDFSSPHNPSFGSTINTVSYRNGDFDGDGKRDIPEY